MFSPRAHGVRRGLLFLTPMHAAVGFVGPWPSFLQPDAHGVCTSRRVDTSRPSAAARADVMRGVPSETTCDLSEVTACIMREAVA
jgi:hypothetical protein